MSDHSIGSPCGDCIDGGCTMNCSSAERASGSEWIAASIWAGVFPAKASAEQVREWRQSTITSQSLDEAVQNLNALANLIGRPPLDDVQLSEEVAVQMAGAIRIVLAHMNERALIIDKAKSGIADALLWLNVDYASGTGYVTRIWEARKALGKVSASLSHGERRK